MRMVYGCSDPRFILGILLFVVGYIINRWADWKLRSLRNLKGDLNHLPEEQEQQGVFSPHPPPPTCMLLVCIPASFGSAYMLYGTNIQSSKLSLLKVIL